MLYCGRFSRFALLLAVAAALFGAGGCATPLVTATSTVHSDGTFRRTLDYQSKFDNRDGKATRCEPVVAGSDLDGKVAPPSGGQWILTPREDSKGNRRIVAGRNVEAGEPLVGDLGVLMPPRKGHAAEPQYTNRVTVTRVGANRVEYREVVRWRGPLPPGLYHPDPAVRQDLQGLLPPGLPRNDAALDRVTVALQRMYCVMFSSMNIRQMRLDDKTPETEQERQLRLALHAELASKSFAALPLPMADAATTTRLADVIAAALVRKSNASAVSKGGDALTHLIGDQRIEFVVHMPGTIVATNGDVNDSSQGHEASWSFFSNAPALGDVTLTATSDSRPASMRYGSTAK